MEDLTKVTKINYTNNAKYFVGRVQNFQDGDFSSVDVSLSDDGTTLTININK